MFFADVVPPPDLGFLPLRGAVVGFFAGRPGVGMLLGTVALLVIGVSVGIVLTGG